MRSKFYIIVICLFQTLSMHSTGQSGDFVDYQNERWTMQAKPLNYNESIYNDFIKFLPKERSWTTANWGGYTAYWEIKNEKLYLSKVEVECYDEKTKKSTLVSVDSLEKHFASYLTPEGIFAPWFSGDVRLPKGKMLLYHHAGFERYFEEEDILTFSQGRLIETQHFNNHRNPGIALLKSSQEIQSRFPWQDFPKLKGTKIILSISQFKVSTDGHFIDGQIHVSLKNKEKTKIKDQNSPTIVAIKETLKQIYPWESFNINGNQLTEYNSFSVAIAYQDPSE